MKSFQAKLFHATARGARALSRFARDASAVAAVEFAVVSPFVIAIAFVTVMVGVVYMAKSQLDTATQAGARAIMTGQVKTTTQLQTAICNYVGGLLNCPSLMVNLNSYSTLSGMKTATPTVTYNSNGTVSNTWGANFGSAGSIMVLQVMYQMPVVGGLMFSFGTQPNGSDLLVSTAVFVNE